MLMATAIMAHWAELLSAQEPCELPAEWEASYVPLDPYLTTTMGADCATKKIRLGGAA